MRFFFSLSPVICSTCALFPTVETLRGTVVFQLTEDPLIHVDPQPETSLPSFPPSVIIHGISLHSTTVVVIVKKKKRQKTELGAK